MNNPAQAFYNWYRETLRNSKYRWLIVLGTLAYLISPIDLAPDFIPILGWIDDGIVATLFVTEVSQILLETLNRRKRGSEVASAEPTDTVIDVNPQ